VSSTIC